MAGVQQPGMTGQVKEDIISRFFELGIEVQAGKLHLHTEMLRPEDFVNGELRFTYCGISFRYVLSTETKMKIEYTDGVSVHFEGSIIDVELSAQIFARSNAIASVTCYINQSTQL